MSKSNEIPGMRLIFAGTPQFAAVALERLYSAGFEVALVLTQPDRPAGRGLKMAPSAVKQLALEHGLPVAQPRSLRLDGKYAQDALAAQQALVEARAEVMVVAAYGLILPQWVLDLPPRGCLNIHGSLLPRWRGAAPIHRAIEAGDARSGITIMQMDAGLDTGAMLLAEAVEIRPDDTTASLHDRLAALGGRLVVEALAAGADLKATPQPLEGVTYAHKIAKAEANIDWTQPAAQIERRLRAFDPFPGACTQIGDEIVKVWRAERVDRQGEPGMVLAVDDAGPVLACGGQALRLLELQRPGGKRVSARAYLQARPLAPGQRLPGA